MVQMLNQFVRAQVIFSIELTVSVPLPVTLAQAVLKSVAHRSSDVTQQVPNGYHSRAGPLPDSLIRKLFYNPVDLVQLSIDKSDRHLRFDKLLGHRFLRWLWFGTTRYAGLVTPRLSTRLLAAATDREGTKHVPRQ
jgi:hypothetical protein